MSKNMTATEVSRHGLEFGKSYDSIFDYDEPFDGYKNHSSKRGKNNNKQGNKATPNPQKGKGKEKIEPLIVFGAVESISVAPVSAVRSKKIKSKVKSGLRSQFIKTTEQSQLNSLIYDQVMPSIPFGLSGMVQASTNGGGRLGPSALQLERQQSASGSVMDCLDLSSSRVALSENDCETYINVERVILDHNNLFFMPLHFLQLPKLRSISFASNLIKEVTITFTMPNLAVLELPSNKLNKFPSADTLKNLPQLRRLILYSNNIKIIPTESVMMLASLGKIEELHLSYNALETLPSCLGKLASLTTLRLAKNKLYSLPESTARLNVIDGNFEIDGNSLSYPPQHVAEQGLSAVTRFFLARKQEKSLQKMVLHSDMASLSGPYGGSFNFAMSPPDSDGCSSAPRSRAGSIDQIFEEVTSSQFKMIVVGHETAGKTSCIRGLTTTIVYLKASNQYGRLLGMYDACKCKVEVIKKDDEEEDDEGDANDGGGDDFSEVSGSGSTTPTATAAASRNASPALPPSSSSSSSSVGTCWSPAGKTTSGRKGKKRQRARQVLYCRLHELEVVGEDDVRRQEALALASSKPKSTIGIDIEKWWPAVAHDFAKRYQEHLLVQAEEEERRLADEASGEAMTDEGEGEGEGVDCGDDGRGGGKRRADQGGFFDVLAHQSDDEVTPSPARTCTGARARTSAGAGVARQSKQKRRQAGKKQKIVAPVCIIPAHDLVLSIWDFAGQEIYHAAQEAFFSRQSLYLVVWNMTLHAEAEMDLYVQFWVDLIQSRAPGSTIVVVASHADKLLSSAASKQQRKHKTPSPPDVCSRLQKHLNRREEARKAVIRMNIDQARAQSEDCTHLKFLLKNRPVVCAVMPVSCISLNGFQDLRNKIISLSTPTASNKHPFNLVNMCITRFYARVKEVVEELRAAGNHVVTMVQLHDQLRQSEHPAAYKKGSPAQMLSQHSVSEVQDAVSFLCSIGEVVWFQPPAAPTTAASSSSVAEDGSIPELGSRDRSGSSGGALSGDEWGESGKDTWRVVEDEQEEHKKEGGASAGAGAGASASAGDERASDVSNMVFLTPHWLMHILKRVLTHHLIKDLRRMIKQMSHEALQDYFGENHVEHSVNGIVRWTLIEDKMLRIKMKFPIEPEADDRRREELKKNVITAIRSLMRKFNIIIPLNMSHNATSDSHHSLSPNTTESPSDADGNSSHDLDPEQCPHLQYFLVPALIDLNERPCIPTVAPRGSVKLERLFRLENFLPPGLLQRIMSRAFFHYGDSVDRRQQEAPRHSGCRQTYQCSARNCWKSAFLQTFVSRQGAITVWVWIEREGNKVEESNFSFPGSNSNININKTKSKGRGSLVNNGSNMVETRGTIHVSVMGNILLCQELMRKLEFYSDIVSEMLNPYLALCHICQSTVCPVCSMAERGKDCGEFSQRQMTDLARDLRVIAGQSASGDESFEWMKRCRRYCRQGCAVNPDLLALVPHTLFADTLNSSPLDRAQTTINFLMEEIVRLSSKPTAQIMNSVCKVGVGFCLEGLWEAAKRSLVAADGKCAGLDLCFPTQNTLLATGAVVDIQSSTTSSGAALLGEPDDLLRDDVFVVSCEHLLGNLVTNTSYLNVFGPQLKPVYLIGDQDHWLYVADLVMRGSEFPNGRADFAAPVHMNREPYQRHKAAREALSSQNHFENLNLQDLQNVTSPSLPMATGPARRAQVVRSNDCGSKIVLENSPPKVWDVAAFKVICKIKPTDKARIEFDVSPRQQKSSSSSSSSGGHFASDAAGDDDVSWRALCPMLGASKLPEVEQTMRLVSYQGMPRSPSGSVSVCWGSINQIMDRQLLINFYSDYGSSGGAVVDRDGHLVGILSNSILKLKQTAYIEPLYPLHNLLRSGVLTWK